MVSLKDVFSLKICCANKITSSRFGQCDVATRIINPLINITPRGMQEVSSPVAIFSSIAAGQMHGCTHTMKSISQTKHKATHTDLVESMYNQCITKAADCRNPDCFVSARPRISTGRRDQWVHISCSILHHCSGELD